MLRVSLVIISMFIVAVCSGAEWTVERLRGEALYQAEQSWLPLSRGQEIGNGVLIRTGASGRVDLARGAEAVTLGANTQIQIRDAGSALMTSIIQESGTVTADVERRNVQHFSVQTPFLAAVVKGTRFVVTVDAGGARVNVERGLVQVQDSKNDRVADIRPGQEAVVTQQAPLDVVGPHAAPVFTFEGVPVAPTAEAATSGKSEDPSPRNSDVNDNDSEHGHDNSGKGSSGNGNGNGNSGNGNGNGGSNGNSGNGNGNGGGNGNSGNGNGNGGGNGNSGNGNGNGSGNGNSGNGNGNGGGNGNSGNGNGNGNGDNQGNGNGNGNGNGRGHNEDD